MMSISYLQDGLIVIAEEKLVANELLQFNLTSFGMQDYCAVAVAMLQPHSATVCTGFSLSSHSRSNAHSYVITATLETGFFSVLSDFMFQHRKNELQQIYSNTHHKQPL